MFLFLRVESESKRVIRLFCGLLVIQAKSLCTKTNRTVSSPPPKIREEGERTGAAVATTLLLENESI